MFEIMFQIMQANRALQAKQAIAKQTAQAEELQKILSALPHLKDMQDFPEVIAGLTLRMKDLGINIGDVDVTQIRRRAELGQVRRDHLKMMELVKGSPDPMIRRQALQWISNAEKNYPELNIKTDRGIVQGQDPLDLALASEPVTYEEAWRRKYEVQAKQLIDAMVAKGMDADEAQAFVNRHMSVLQPWIGPKMQSRDIEERQLSVAQAAKAQAEAEGVGTLEPGFRNALNNFIKIGGDIQSFGGAVQAYRTQITHINEFIRSKEKESLVQTWRMSKDPVLRALAENLPRINPKDLPTRVSEMTTELFTAQEKLRGARARHADLLKTYPELQRYSNIQPEVPAAPTPKFAPPVEDTGGGVQTPGGVRPPATGRQRPRISDPLAPTIDQRNKPQGGKAPSTPQAPGAQPVTARPPGVPRQPQQPAQRYAYMKTPQGSQRIPVKPVAPAKPLDLSGIKKVYESIVGTPGSRAKIVKGHKQARPGYFYDPQTDKYYKR